DEATSGRAHAEPAESRGDPQPTDLDARSDVRFRDPGSARADSAARDPQGLQARVLRRDARGAEAGGLLDRAAAPRRRTGRTARSRRRRTSGRRARRRTRASRGATHAHGELAPVRVPELPHDAPRARHLEEAPLLARADERVAVGEALAARDEEGEE